MDCMCYYRVNLVGNPYALPTTTRYALAAQGLRLRQYKLHLLEDIDALERKRKVQTKGAKNVEKIAMVCGSLSSETDSSNDMSNESEKEKLLALELEALEHSMELLESGQSMLEVSKCAFKVFPFAYNMYVCMQVFMYEFMYAHLLVYVYVCTLT